MSTGNSLALLPFFVRDYIAATRHLSLAERGAYTDLLFLSWEMGALPSDPAWLARLVGCGAEEFRQVWPAIRGKFIETEAGFVNARLEEHRAESMQRSAAARASAQARWNRYPGCDRNANAMRTHSDGNANGYANGHAKSMLPSPSPSPSPNPDSGVSFGDSRPRRARTSERPAHERQEFHDQVIEAYRQALPDLPAVKVWSKTRRQALNSRIRERLKDGKPADTVDYWRKFFAGVAASDFLCGRITPRDGRAPFRADLEWLIRPENFAKVIEGRYSAGNGNGRDRR